MILDLTRRPRYFQAHSYIAAFPVVPPRLIWPARLVLSRNKSICPIQTAFCRLHLRRFVQRSCLSLRSSPIQEQRIKLPSRLDILSSFSFVRRGHWTSLQNVAQVAKIRFCTGKNNKVWFTKFFYAEISYGYNKKT